MAVLSFIGGTRRGCSVDRAQFVLSEGNGFDTHSGRLAPYWLGRSQYNMTAEIEVVVWPLCACVKRRKYFQTLALEPVHGIA